jgi:shikimate dehydrogenase
MIDVNTKLVGLLGYPLEHSYSPIMQNGAFQALGLNYVYIPIEVTEDNLGDVVKGICKMNFAGFNVTIPHKINVMKYLDEIDDVAKVIGAVNTVTIKDGRSKGYNTDGEGFILSLEKGTGISAKGKNVFIIGSGGASRAIAMTLAFRGANKIYICNRTAQNARALSDEINSKVRDCSTTVPMEYGPMAQALKDVDILINTTSVGMFPKVDDIPIEKELIDQRIVVCDIVYNPIKTNLLKEAEKAGCKTVDGLGMLVNQGAEAFKLWTGLEPPVEDMYNILFSIVK